MARPNKTGLDYFPLDVDFFEDMKAPTLFDVVEIEKTNNEMKEAI
jgi:hypothetical protein